MFAKYYRSRLEASGAAAEPKRGISVRKKRVADVHDLEYAEEKKSKVEAVEKDAWPMDRRPRRAAAQKVDYSEDSVDAAWDLIIKEDAPHEYDEPEQAESTELTCRQQCNKRRKPTCKQATCKKSKLDSESDEDYEDFQLDEPEPAAGKSSQPELTKSNNITRRKILKKKSGRIINPRAPVVHKKTKQKMKKTSGRIMTPRAPVIHKKKKQIKPPKPLKTVVFPGRFSDHFNTADESTLPTLEWSLGTIMSKDGRQQSVWISPTRKITFYHEKDAHQFEAVRRKYGTDEVKAWEEWTKMRTGCRDGTGVYRPRQYDAPGTLRVYHYQNCLTDKGWIKKPVVQRDSNIRYHWLSPVYSIEFRYSGIAKEFEELRQKCNGDECKAWDLFVKKQKRQNDPNWSSKVIGGHNALSLAQQN